MSNYFNIEVYGKSFPIWNYPNRKFSPRTRNIQQKLGQAFSSFTGLADDTIHWCPGLWLVLGDTGVGKSTIINALYNGVRDGDTTYAGNSIYNLGEPGADIFPYAEDQWNQWCAALAFADNPDVTVLTSPDAVNSSVVAALHAVRSHLMISDYDGAMKAYSSLASQIGSLYDGCTNDEKTNIMEGIRKIASLLSEMYSHMRENRTILWYGKADDVQKIDDAIGTVKAQMETETILDDKFEYENFVADKPILFIDSLTQLPYRSTTLSYTSGGLSIEVFRALSQIDYIARLTDRVIIATFNPTVFSRQIFADFYNAIPGVATGSLFFTNERGADNTRTINIRSRLYPDDGEKAELRFEETVTYSIYQNQDGGNGRSQNHEFEVPEDDFAPSQFF